MESENQKEEEIRQERLRFARKAAEEVKRWDDWKRYMAFSQSNIKKEKSDDADNRSD